MNAKVLDCQISEVKSPCFHCGLPVPPHTNYKVTIFNQSRSMCCPGCQSVAETIVANQLENFYHYRDQLSVTQQQKSMDKMLARLGQFETQQVATQSSDNQEGNEQQITLLLENLTCPACVWLVEKILKRLSGVNDVAVNLSNHTVLIRWNPKHINLSTILQTISNSGYEPHPYHPRDQQTLRLREKKLVLRRLGISGLGMLQVMMYAVDFYTGYLQNMPSEIRLFFHLVSFFLTGIVIFTAGNRFLLNAWIALKSKQLTMDVNIAIAIIAAFLMSAYSMLYQSGYVYFDSICMFIFLLNVSRYAELSAYEGTNHVLHKLATLLPEEAVVIEANGSLKTRHIDEITANQRLLIKSGEIIPVDGWVSAGESSVNEMILSGEAIPKAKKTGDCVFAGTQNIDHVLEVTVSNGARNNRINQILELANQALSIKPKLAVLADRIAHYFVIAVLLTVIFVAVIWWLISPEKAFAIALATLVISCPCALSLATPTALTTITNAFAKLGFFCLQPNVADHLAKVTDCIFDKTGTLTEGNFSIITVIPLSTFSKNECLAIASALEAYSEHPLAKAFQCDLQNPLQVDNIKNFVSQGIEGQINNAIFRIGKKDFVAKCWQQLIPCHEPQDQNESTVWILLGNTQGPVAWIGLRDEIRASAKDCIYGLKKLGISLHILSGDVTSNVAAVAAAVGITEVAANQTAEDKYHYIEKIRNNGGVVMMVGDGVNDTPGMSAAHVSIAMNNAMDLTKSSADSLLISNDLNLLPIILQGARKTQVILKQNFLWALLYNLLLLPVAAMGFVSPYLAALGMSMSSLIVVINALRLRKTSTWKASIF